MQLELFTVLNGEYIYYNNFPKKSLDEFRKTLELLSINGS